MLHIARRLTTDEVEMELNRVNTTLMRINHADEATIAELVEAHDSEDKTDLVLHLENERRIFKDEFEYRKGMEFLGI